MIIRREVVEAFEDVGNLNFFEGYMVEHLRKFAPMHSKLLGEEGVRPIIRLAIERARNYRLTKRGPVQFYTELIFLFGVDFDTDPQFPWCGEILRGGIPADQGERAEQLHYQAMLYIGAVGGPDRAYAHRALHKSRELRFDGPPLSTPNYGDQVMRGMREAYPEKYEYVGEQQLRALIPRALEEARKYSVATDAGIALFTGLMYALGHGVVTDPKYPFIERTLRNEALADPNKRAERVHSKVMTYLDHVLQNLGKG